MTGTHIEIPLQLNGFEKNSHDREILNEVSKCRETAWKLKQEQRFIDAFERTVESMRLMKQFSDFENIEFRALLCGLLFDLSEIHFELKDYKQSERELETLFKVLDKLVKIDSERFGPFHILAMEHSTRILRSRKKTLDVLSRQQVTTSTLYEKVNAGLIEATDKLVDSMCKTAGLLASTGKYREALKFYAEAIKISKKRTGKVTRKEVEMTVDMAVIMLRIRSFRPRAARLLNAILPHAITLGAVELEDDILALLSVMNLDSEGTPRWRAFISRIGSTKKTKE